MMMELISKNKFRCFCGKSIDYDPEDILANHIETCTEYHRESPLGKVFYKINMKELEVGHLLALRSEYLKHALAISEELKFKKKNEMEIEREKERPAEKNNSFFFEPNKEEPMRWNFNENYIECQFCQKKFLDDDVKNFWYLVQCYHCICRGCLVKHIQTNYIKERGNVKCPLPLCNSYMTEDDTTAIIQKEKLEKMNQELLELQFNIITCFKCQEKFEFVEGKADPKTKDEKGRLLTAQQNQNYIQNRFVCPNHTCRTEQCRTCKSTPYHIGYTCEEWKNYSNMKKCRYCESPFSMDKIDKSLPLALQFICKSEECQRKMKLACQKTLNCEHPCCGYFKEINCLECIDDECAEKYKEKLMSQKGSDFCNICFTEGLCNGPCVKVKCGHIFHVECVTKRIDLRWTSPRIGFTFCLCPLCKTWMEFPIDSPLQVKMERSLALYEDIKKKAFERLKHEAKDKDERLSRVGDAFYQKPVEYAMAIFSYYECFKCKNPYFGGLKSCGDRGPPEEDKNQDFKPEELVCANCCEIPIDDCKKHGKDYIEFKCKFCCSIAQWYCWGSTHFCEPCHKRQCSGDYVSKYTIDKLPKCPGIEGCPLKIAHKPNGEECALGCSLCRNYVENLKKD